MNDYIKDNNTSACFRTWVEIDKQAMKHNYLVFRKKIEKGTKLAAVVKSNAYGHDIIQFSKELVRLGVDVLAVDSVVEAFVLRDAGIVVPILVLGYSLPAHLEEAAERNIAVTVSSHDMLREIQKHTFSQKLNVHIKLDTGMHRQGFSAQGGSALGGQVMDRLFGELEKLKDKINVEGVYTHFAAAKDPDGPDETKNQIKEFERWAENFENRGYSPTKHTCATAGALLYPSAHFDMVRIGIGMCGLWPSAEVKVCCEKSITLKPALEWKTVITETKTIQKGESIGYDFTEELSRDSVVGICPVGYWHGYRRSLSSKAYVLAGEDRVKILGRVSMDMIAIDLTDTEAKAGDTVTLLGVCGQNKIPAEELAGIMQTINYEVVTGINPRIKRIYR